MNTEERLVAELRVEGEQGQVKRVKDAFTTFLKSAGLDGIRVNANLGQGVISVYGQIDDARLEAFAKARGEHIEVRYLGSRLQTHLEMDPKTQELVQNYRILLRGNAELAAQSAALADKVQALQTQLTAETERRRRSEQDADHFLEQNAKLEDRVALLQREQGRLMDGGIERAALMHLAGYAAKLARAEEQLEALGNTKRMAIEDVLGKISRLGINAATAEEATDIINSYLASESKLESLFESINPERAAGYKAAKELLGKREREREQVPDAIKALPEEQIKLLREVYDTFIAADRQTISDYESELKNYKQRTRQELTACGEQFKEIEQQGKLRQAAAEILGKAPLPVYIAVADEEQAYTVKVHLPLTKGRSRALDTLISQNIISEDVIDLLDVRDVGSLAAGTEPETMLETYTVTLPKDRYTAGDAMNIKAAIERNAWTAYEESPVSELGIGLSFIVNTTATTLMQPQQAKRDNELKKTLEEIFEGSPQTPYSSTQLAELARERLGRQVNRGAVLYILTAMPDVNVTGKSRATRYTYAPKRQEPAVDL